MKKWGIIVDHLDEAIISDDLIPADASTLQIFDDDNILYFTGYVVMFDEDAEAEIEEFMEAAGATKLVINGEVVYG